MALGAAVYQQMTIWIANGDISINYEIKPISRIYNTSPNSRIMSYNSSPNTRIKNDKPSVRGKKII